MSMPSRSVHAFKQEGATRFGELKAYVRCFTVVLDNGTEMLSKDQLFRVWVGRVGEAYYSTITEAKVTYTVGFD